MNYFDNLYTIIEIGINHNYSKGKLNALSKFLNKKNIEGIRKNFPELTKFLPYCNWYTVQNKNMLAMSAYIYDIYKSTGILPNIQDFDINPDIDRLEHWQYINPLVFEINPETDFEFAKDIFPDCNIWNLFLSGSARINYYEEDNISLEQRIKYAIVEYMVRRPQFYSTNDFIDNDILHKKYKKKKNEDYKS